MSEKPRLLIGGEQLAGKVIVKTSGQPKNPPYSFEEGRRRISANLNQVVSAVYELPDAACPNEETVAVLTVHPRYVSKSDQPAKLLKHVGLRALGSRPAKVTPDNWGIKKHPDEAISEELFVAGKREAIKKWSSELKVWTPNTPGAETIQTLEKVTEFAASQKIKGRPSDGEEAVYEVVLQGIAPFIIDAFEEYSISLGYQPQMDRLRRVRGLGFLPMRGDNKSLSKLAAFSFLRVVRGMPSLRPQRPRLIRSSGPTHFPVTLPDSQTTFGGHAVTFDGGLSEEAADALKPWVTLVASRPGAT